MSKVITQPDGTQIAEFRYDFFLDSKAQTVTETEDGDLIIEGYASDYGVDRQEEAFEPGAFEEGLKAFMATNPIMLFHHKFDQALGRFVDARIDGKGLWVKGVVDKPEPGTWAADVFSKIKKGTIKAFSVGGIFKRRMTPQGPRIFKADLAEISVTPLAINPRTTFAVVGAKAFEGVEIPALPNVDGDVREDDEWMVKEAVSMLESVFSRIEKRTSAPAEV